MFYYVEKHTLTASIGEVNNPQNKTKKATSSNIDALVKQNLSGCYELSSADMTNKKALYR